MGVGVFGVVVGDWLCGEMYKEEYWCVVVV